VKQNYASLYEAPYMV